MEISDDDVNEIAYFGIETAQKSCLPEPCIASVTEPDNNQKPKTTRTDDKKIGVQTKTH